MADIFKSIQAKLGSEADMNRLYSYLAAVGMAEGTGSRTQRQISGKGIHRHGGPARGLYQIEPATAKTFSNRYAQWIKSSGEEAPEWYAKWRSGNSLNASNLGKREQAELLMADYLGNKGNWRNFESYMKGDITAGELAARNHKRVFRGSNAEKDRVNYVSKIDKYQDKYATDKTATSDVIFNNNWTSGIATAEFDDSAEFLRGEYNNMMEDTHVNPDEPEAEHLTGTDDSIESSSAPIADHTDDYTTDKPEDSDYFSDGLRNTFND